MNQNSQPFVVPRGQPGSTLMIVLPSQIYLSLLEDARAQMPASVAGALVGRIETPDGDEPGAAVAIEEATPIELRSAGVNLTIDAKGWEAVKVRLAAEGTRRIVAWFYADSGLAIFQPRIDLLETQRALAPDTDLLLLFNPAIDQGAFYNWRDGGFVPVGGFYEALPYHDSKPLVLWNGEIHGAATWLNISVTLDDTPPASSLGGIEATSLEKPTEPLNILQEFRPQEFQASDARDDALQAHVSLEAADQTPRDPLPERTAESLEPTVTEVNPTAPAELAELPPIARPQNHNTALLPMPDPLSSAALENDFAVEASPSYAVHAPEHETPSNQDDELGTPDVPALSSAMRGLTETIVVGNVPNEVGVHRTDGALDAGEGTSAEVTQSDAHHHAQHGHYGHSPATESESPTHNEHVATLPPVPEAPAQEPSTAVGSDSPQEQPVAPPDDTPAFSEADDPSGVGKEPQALTTSDSSAARFPPVTARAQASSVGSVTTEEDAGSVWALDKREGHHVHHEPGATGSTWRDASEASSAEPTIAPTESEMKVLREVKLATVRRSGTLKKVVAPAAAGLALVFFLFWLYFSARPATSGSRQAQAISPSPTTSIVRIAQALPLSSNTPPGQTATTTVSHALPQPQPSLPPPATSTSLMSSTPALATPTSSSVPTATSTTSITTSTFTPTSVPISVPTSVPISTPTSVLSLAATPSLAPTERAIANPPPVVRTQTPVVAPTFTPKVIYTKTATAGSLASATRTTLVRVSTATTTGHSATPTNSGVDKDTATPAPPPTTPESPTPAFSFPPAPTETGTLSAPTPTFSFPPAPTETAIPATFTPVFSFPPVPTETETDMPATTTPRPGSSPTPTGTTITAASRITH